MAWWIDKPKILGSGNPGIDKLRELRKEGFDTVICLLENMQLAFYSVDEAEMIGYTIHSIPIANFRSPALPQMKEFLTLVDSSLQQGGKVIIHCLAGMGRTGTMAAAYWINKGLSAQEAIVKTRQCNPSAIETTVQENSLFELEDVLGAENA